MRNVDIYKASKSNIGRRILVDHGKSVPQPAIDAHGPVEFEKTVDLDARGLIGADPTAMGAALDADGWATWPTKK